MFDNDYASLRWAEIWEGGARRGWNRYKQHILPLHGGKGIYYGEIMIYVNDRRDVKLSKGWRYEPIMINAPHPQPPSTLLCDQRWSSSALLSIPPLCCSSSAFVAPHSRPVLWFHALFFPCPPPSSDIVLSSSLLLLPICCCLFLATRLCGDQCCGSWWIPMIQRFREQGARQSPLSCGWAICLCQTPTPPCLQHGPDSEQEEEEEMRKRNYQYSVQKIKYTRWWYKQRKDWQGEAWIPSSTSFNLKYHLFIHSPADDSIHSGNALYAMWAI